MPRLSWWSAVAICALLAPDAAAKKADPGNYVHPHFADFGVRSIAVLPMVALHQREVAEWLPGMLEQGVVPLGYRWVGTSTLRLGLTTDRSAELDRLVEKFRRGSLDTTTVRNFGTAISADAMLATSVTTWESTIIPVNVSGQSLTQIGLVASLYSSRSGELLWSRRFLVKGEGPYNNPGEQVNLTTPIKVGIPTPEAASPTSLAPPTYQDVARTLILQLRAALPAPPKPAVP